MKKNILAVSISAAVLSFGLVGGAQAVTSVAGASTGTALTLNGDGVGHMLVVPYFTAQAENSTLINLVNTDTVNGKAVKIRFRGAANSDDLLDFQVFLSPGDVWAANISKNPTTGYAQLTTKDNSCLIPAKAAGKGATTTFAFSDFRLDTGYMTGADAKAAGTREGYVEIFNMADIPPVAAYPSTATVGGTIVGNTIVLAAGIAASTSSTANPLFTAIKHAAQEAPCGTLITTTLAALDPVFEANQTAAPTLLGSVSNGMLAPTTGLMANWTIINVVGAAAWSGKAVAIQASVTGVTTATTKGNLVFFPQKAAAQLTPQTWTADPLLRAASFRLDSLGEVTSLMPGSITAVLPAAITTQTQDLPDMSTPYFEGAIAETQAVALTRAFAAKTARNEFLTDASINASTDWVFSMPTRRYNAALNYGAINAPTSIFGGVDTGVRFTNLDVASYVATGAQWVPAFGAQANDDNNFFNKNNAKTVQSPTVANSASRMLCVSGITTSWLDREETAPVSGAVATVSPTPIVPGLVFCGEDQVLSFNLGTSAAPSRSLKSTLTLKDLDLGLISPTLAFADGWMTLATPGLTRLTNALVTSTAATTTTPATVALQATTAGNNGLPVIGGAFMKAAAGTATFGTYFDHRFTR